MPSRVLRPSIAISNPPFWENRSYRNHENISRTFILAMPGLGRLDPFIGHPRSRQPCIFLPVPPERFPLTHHYLNAGVSLDIGSPMAAGDDYRIKAADMNAKARQETRPHTRSELKKLVLAYLRLADHADRNADVAPSVE